jgi:hypothetical protein
MEKWIIPCNPKYYDVDGAFGSLVRINWKQSVDIQVGDIVYIYVGKPISSIKYETKATKVNLSKETVDDKDYVIDGSNYENYGRYMELQLLRKFGNDLLPYELLKVQGLNSVQGPRRISYELEKFILKKTSQLKEYKATESKLDQELIDEIDDMIPALSKKEFNYSPEPRMKIDAILSNGKKIYPRDRKTAINALIRAKHSCEIEENHHSFIRKNTNTKYAEPHHLIPMANQDLFDNSLDVEANIVSLCSNCHNQIHYGAGSEKLIELLYIKRKKELEQAGIPISIEDLLNLY